MKLSSSIIVSVAIIIGFIILACSLPRVKITPNIHVTNHENIYAERELGIGANRFKKIKILLGRKSKVIVAGKGEYKEYECFIPYMTKMGTKVLMSKRGQSSFSDKTDFIIINYPVEFLR